MLNGDDVVDLTIGQPGIANGKGDILVTGRPVTGRPPSRHPVTGRPPSRRPVTAVPSPALRQAGWIDPVGPVGDVVVGLRFPRFQARAGDDGRNEPGAAADVR